jgi:hypothetical protein
VKRFVFLFLIAVYFLGLLPLSGVSGNAAVTTLEYTHSHSDDDHEHDHHHEHEHQAAHSDASDSEDSHPLTDDSHHQPHSHEISILNLVLYVSGSDPGLLALNPTVIETRFGISIALRPPGEPWTGSIFRPPIA